MVFQIPKYLQFADSTQIPLSFLSREYVPLYDFLGGTALLRFLHLCHPRQAIPLRSLPELAPSRRHLDEKKRPYHHRVICRSSALPKPLHHPLSNRELPSKVCLHTSSPRFSAVFFKLLSHEIAWNLGDNVC